MCTFLYAVLSVDKLSVPRYRSCFIFVWSGKTKALELSSLIVEGVVLVDGSSVVSVTDLAVDQVQISDDNDTFVQIQDGQSVLTEQQPVYERLCHV